MNRNPYQEATALALIGIVFWTIIWVIKGGEIW